MIHVKFSYDRDSRQIEMRVKGHADAAPKGKDVICAGVSALVTTATCAVCTLFMKGLLDDIPITKMTPGDSVLIAKPLPETEAEALMVFWTIQEGISAMEQVYSDYLCLDQTL